MDSEDEVVYIEPDNEEPVESIHHLPPHARVIGRRYNSADGPVVWTGTTAVRQTPGLSPPGPPPGLLPSGWNEDDQQKIEKSWAQADLVTPKGRFNKKRKADVVEELQDELRVLKELKIQEQEYLEICRASKQMYDAKTKENVKLRAELKKTQDDLESMKRMWRFVVFERDAHKHLLEELNWGMPRD